MTAWTKEDLYALDEKYAAEGVRMHQRPLRAAMELMGSSFSMGTFGSPEVKRITEAYAQLIPEVNSTWPGAGIGLAVSIDQVRKLTLAVVFGSRRIEPWEATGFDSREEWWEWCRGQLDIASDASFALADLFDFSCGLNELQGGNAEALKLWQMARSSQEDVSNTMPTTFSVDSVIQPICMVAELSIKAALVWDGADPKSFKGPNGHDLSTLAGRMATARPHRDDPLIQSVIARLPHYVQSRYSPADLTRLAVARLALGVQFVAASTVRRISTTDMAAEMESGGWPAPRRPFFPLRP